MFNHNIAILCESSGVCLLSALNKVVLIPLFPHIGEFHLFLVKIKLTSIEFVANPAVDFQKRKKRIPSKFKKGKKVRSWCVCM